MMLIKQSQSTQSCFLVPSPWILHVHVVPFTLLSLMSNLGIQCQLVKFHFQKLLTTMDLELLTALSSSLAKLI